MSWSNALALNGPEWMLPCLHRRLSFPAQPPTVTGDKFNSEMQCVANTSEAAR